MNDGVWKRVRLNGARLVSTAVSYARSVRIPADDCIARGAMNDIISKQPPDLEIKLVFFNYYYFNVPCVTNYFPWDKGLFLWITGWMRDVRSPRTQGLLGLNIWFRIPYVRILHAAYTMYEYSLCSCDSSYQWSMSAIKAYFFPNAFNHDFRGIVA